MNTFPRCRRFTQAYAFVASLVAGTLCFVNASCAETFSDQGVTHYLHHKLGFHDFLYGPNGVVPRYTGLPAHTRTQDNVSLLHGTYHYRVIPNGRVAQRNVPSRTTRFDDLNLSVTMPAGPWTKLDPKQTGSRACFLASRTDPTIMISLAGVAAGVEPREQGDFEATGTNRSLLDESQAKMLSLPGGKIEPGERELSAGGIRGIAYEATVRNGESTTYYALWVAAHHGYHYKLAVYGDYLHKRMIDEAMQNFLRGLKPIQPNRVAQRTTANHR